MRERDGGGDLRMLAGAIYIMMMMMMMMMMMSDDAVVAVVGVGARKMTSTAIVRAIVCGAWAVLLVDCMGYEVQRGVQWLWGWLSHDEWILPWPMSSGYFLRVGFWRVGFLSRHGEGVIG